MKRFAIDVVILPPDPVMDVAIQWNQKLCEAQPGNIVLDRTYRLPHISMAMGCLRADQLEHAYLILQTISGQHHGVELFVPRIKTLRSATGSNVISFDIDVSPELAALHESIVNAFGTLLTQDAVAADVNDIAPIDSAAIDWINRYIPNYCYDNFWPHITLGFGESPNDFQPYSFQASRLAVCHLGNYCTCTKILCETLLNAEWNYNL